MGYSDFSNHYFTSFDHLILNYIVDFQINYLVYYTLIIIYALAQLVLLFVTHALEQFPSKEIFHTLLCWDIDQYYDHFVYIPN
jgi:hypothetical protein